MRGASGRHAEAAPQSALGFDSLFGLLAWAGALLLLLVAPSQIANFWPADFNFWPQALFTLLLAGIAILLAIARLPLPRWDGVATALSLFLGWSLLTVFTGTYAHDAWLELARISGALAFFWIVRAFPLPAQKLALVAAAVIGVAYVGGGALLDFIATRNPRQFGTFFNPNLFANALALAPAALHRFAARDLEHHAQPQLRFARHRAVFGDTARPRRHLKQRRIGGGAGRQSGGGSGDKGVAARSVWRGVSPLVARRYCFGCGLWRARRRNRGAAFVGGARLG